MVSRLTTAPLLAISALSVLLPSASAQGAQPLGKAATEAMAARYASSKHWVQKAVILLSMNQYWHPAGAPMFVSALKDRDKRLQAYGIEGLLRADAALLPSVASAELIQELIKQAGHRNKFVRGKILTILSRVAPGVKADKKSRWSSWWSSARKDYQPKPWQARTVEKGKGDNTVAFADRAFDLYNAGLDLGICIDSTGSMQPSIDAVSAALGEMVDLLNGISPKLRVGIAHYKDLQDFGSSKGGAKIMVPLTKNVAVARKRLLKLKAAGGGDLPERVANGLELCTSKKMKWQADANKVVIVIGDAPPHNESGAVDRAKLARTDPGSLTNRPTTGPKAKLRPFMTSTIGVKLKLPPGLPNVSPAFFNGQKRMAESFQAIAKAGGGVYGELVFDMVVEKGKLVPRKANKAGGAAQTMVSHILALSFGKEHEQSMRTFVKIYYDYKAEKFFK